MSTHTPGPWIHEGMGAVMAIIDGKPRQVATVTGGAPQYGDAGTEPQAILLANADLIAASPDLLASLEEQVTEFDRRMREYADAGDHQIAAIARRHHGARIERSRAAIAKARGGR